MINKVSRYKDQGIGRQVDNVVQHQFIKYKEVDVTIPSTGVPVRIDIGFLADRAIPVAGYIGMQIEIVDSDKRYLYVQSNSGTGDVTLKVWANDRNPIPLRKARIVTPISIPNEVAGSIWDSGASIWDAGASVWDV